MKQIRLDSLKEAIIPNISENTAIGLCGGRSITPVFEILLELKISLNENKFYQVDERLSPPFNLQDLEKSFLEPAQVKGLLKREQFTSLSFENKEYIEKTILSGPCINFLGVGEDGHIASIFPGANFSNSTLIEEVNDSPKPPARRLTLTPEAIRKAECNFLLFFGENKRNALENIDSLPCSIGKEAKRCFVVTD